VSIAKSKAIQKPKQSERKGFCSTTERIRGRGKPKTGITRLREIAGYQKSISQSNRLRMEGPYTGDTLPFLLEFQPGVLLIIPAPSQQEADRLVRECVEPEAVQLLLASSANIFWAWSLLAEAIDNSNQRVTLAAVQKIIALTVEDYFNDLGVQHLVPLEFEALSRIDSVQACEQGIWLLSAHPRYPAQEKKSDGSNGHFNLWKNPIFAIYETLPDSCKNDPRTIKEPDPKKPEPLSRQAIKNFWELKLARLQRIAQMTMQEDENCKNMLGITSMHLPYRLPADSEDDWKERIQETGSLINELVEQDAFELLKSVSSNRWWYWRVLYLSSYVGRTRAITKSDMQRGIFEAIRALRMEPEIGDNWHRDYDALSNDTLEAMLKHGVWLRHYDGRKVLSNCRPNFFYEIVRNPIIEAYDDLPAELQVLTKK